MMPPYADAASLFMRDVCRFRHFLSYFSLLAATPLFSPCRRHCAPMLSLIFRCRHTLMLTPAFASAR